MSTDHSSALRPPLLGAHVSTAGGVDRAVLRAEALACSAAQIFVKSPNQWRLPDLPDAVERRWHELRLRRLDEGVRPVRFVAHAAYLINLSAPEPSLWERSCEALFEEWERCWRLGIEALVVHPGSHRELSKEAGLERVRTALSRLGDAVGRAASSIEGAEGLGRPVFPLPHLLLENTAGSGSQLGRTLEELAHMLRGFAPPDAEGRDLGLGVCVDTCHAWAAGYDLRRYDGWSRLVDTLDQLIGVGRLRCLHLNDSQHDLGSHRDRHANIGRGQIGSRAFGRIVRSEAVAGLPLLLETPSGTRDQRQGCAIPAGHAADLRRLRAMLGRR